MGKLCSTRMKWSLKLGTYAGIGIFGLAVGAADAGFFRGGALREVTRR